MLTALFFNTVQSPTTNKEFTHGHTDGGAFELVKACEVVQVAPAVLTKIVSCRAQDSLENFCKSRLISLKAWNN
jgi:hypothetical protein